MKKKAVVLLSGGLDSATTLAIAKSEGYDVYALSFRYGQRNSPELESGNKLCDAFNIQHHKIFDINLGQIGGSALTDNIDVPKREFESEPPAGIPATYVPGRNLIFLSLGLAWAEVLGADDIFIGVNAVDYSGYPDCRPEFIESFEKIANLATKAGVSGSRFTIHAPLIHLSKADIIRKGTELGVDYSLTVTCYDPDEKGRACGECDSCRLRKLGFRDAGIADPTRYQKN